MRSAFFTAFLMRSGLILGLPAALCAQTVPIVRIAPESAKELSPGLISLLERSVVERLGPGATVSVALVGEAPTGTFVSATPDPLGRLGQAINFTLTSSAVGGRTVRVRARVDVTAPHVQAKSAILRGHAVAADDVEVVNGPLVGLPIKRLPALAQIVGQPALRPIDRGQIVEASFVAVRHVVQAGDTVTVVATVGAVQVTAMCVAADSGDPGDIVRVVNRDTHRSLRARVVNKGVVEVIRGDQ